MERIKYLGKVLAIGARITTTTWLAVLANVTAAAAFLGFTVVVQFTGLPDFVKYVVPAAFVLAILVEGGFRHWRDEAVERALANANLREMARLNGEALEARSSQEGPPEYLFKSNNSHVEIVGGMRIKGASDRPFLDASNGSVFKSGIIDMEK